MTPSIEIDRRLVRESGKSVRYALLSFVAPDPPRAVSRPPLNVAFVLDRSGSMGGSKIALARQAIVDGIRLLSASDRFSVVSFDEEIDVVVPSTRVSPEAVRNAIDRVRTIEARGGTDLSAGWLRGCEQIAAHLSDGETTRCIVLSDGQANHGIIDLGVLAQHATELGARGVTTSCLGIGADYDERVLAAIATGSGGHSYHVETAVQIPDFLSSELGEALETVARRVTVSVRGAEGIDVTTLNAYRIVPGEDGSAILQLGDLVSRQEVALVFRLKFPRGTAGESRTLAFAVRDEGGVFVDPAREVTFAFASHADNDAQARNRDVDRAVAELYAAAARAEALEMNRRDRYDEANDRLERTARKIEGYAGSDPVLRRIIEELRERRETYMRPLAAMYRKVEYSANVSAMAARDDFGRARRLPKQP